MSKGSKSSGGDLPHVSPIAAFGPFLCGIGGIWTIITYMTTLGGINKVNSNANLQWFMMFIPILSAIHLGKAIDALNDTAEEKGVPGGPVSNNIIINFLLPFLPMYSLFNRWNEVADHIEGK
jgi:hypothetical protein